MDGMHAADPGYIITLVHGIAVYSNKKPFSHAWIEQGDMVVSMALLNEYPVMFHCDKESFYKAFSIVHTTRYTPQEAIAQFKASGFKGPWKKEYLLLAKTDKDDE